MRKIKFYKDEKFDIKIFIDCQYEIYLTLKKQKINE